MQVLLLNATFEPLGTIAWERAVVLVLDNSVDVLEVSGKVARSAKLTIEIPSVIRLRTNLRVARRGPVGYSRMAVLRRDGHRCAYCNRRASTIDHVTPRCRGGKSSWENTVAACMRCNHRKAARTPVEAGLTMLVAPGVPHDNVRVKFGVNSIPVSWEPWLATAT